MSFFQYYRSNLPCRSSFILRRIDTRGNKKRLGQQLIGALNEWALLTTRPVNLPKGVAAWPLFVPSRAIAICDDPMHFILRESTFIRLHRRHVARQGGVAGPALGWPVRWLALAGGLRRLIPALCLCPEQGLPPEEGLPEGALRCL